MSVKELVGTKSFDYLLFSLWLTLICIGWLMIYSVGHKTGYNQEFSDFIVHTPAGKQTIFIGIAAILTFVIMTIDWKFWRTFAWLIYGFGLILLVLVLIIGVKVNGARAWFGFGGFGFQPVEVAKVGTCLALSSFLSGAGASLRDGRSRLTILGILLTPVLLILLQPDLGSCLVFSSFALLLYREGLSPMVFYIIYGLAILFILALLFDNDATGVVLFLAAVTCVIFALNIQEHRRSWLMVVGAAILLAGTLYFRSKPILALSTMAVALGAFVVVHSRRGRFRMVILTGSVFLLSSAIVYGTNFVFLHVLQKHQQERINVWLHLERCDPRGVAYNVIHSKMAIGSGGFTGKGFLDGAMTKLNYVPEQSTDFIFCTVGEEQGFIGVLGAVIVFCLFLIRLVQIAERQRSHFSRLYAYGVTGIFFFHFIVNIGMTMNLLPVIGIPLPFISAGGSSLLGFTALIAILLKLDSHRYSI